MFLFFFFQAEDGIRYDLVTGVQTCALPICSAAGRDSIIGRVMDDQVDDLDSGPFEVDPVHHALLRSGVRDLKTPKPRVRTSHEEDVGNRRTLPGILAHYDRSVRCTRQPAREAPRISGVRLHSAPQ